MTGGPWRVVCYMARRHGLMGAEALLKHPDYQVVALLTHRRLARFEDEQRGERPDYADYEALASGHGVPLMAVDGKAARAELPTRLVSLKADVFAVISWRFLVTPAEMEQARFGGVNVHRGRLPAYAGAFPLARALEAGDKEITVTAHELTEGIDEGPVLATSEHPVTARPDESIDERVSRLKVEIEPLFGPLLIAALDRHLGLRARSSD